LTTGRETKKGSAITAKTGTETKTKFNKAENVKLKITLATSGTYRKKQYK